MLLFNGIATLWIRHINFSVSAAVLFIVLFGILVQNGVRLVREINRLGDAKEPHLRSQCARAAQTRPHGSSLAGDAR